MFELSRVDSIISFSVTAPQCGSNPNWYFYNNNCYMLNPTSGPNATLSWYDAKDYCNGINSHLASIHTNDENSFLEGLVSIVKRLMSVVHNFAV